MKIALVSPYDWNVPGGVKTHIEHLAAELRRRNHIVHIIAPTSARGDQRIEFGVYNFGWIAPVRINGSVARVAITPTLTGSLRRLMQREHFDILHLHEPMVSTLTLALLRIADTLGIPCVGTFHAATAKRSSTASWAYAMASPFLQASFRRLDACIAVSEAARDHVQRIFAADYQIIPNGIDIDLFSPAVKPLPRLAGDTQNVLFLSRLEPRKGLRYFLKAIPLVREHMGQFGDRPVRFVIAGEGASRARFERYIQQKGWHDVEFTGYVPEVEKPQYFAAAAVYCAPATGGESQGVILLEAMATGTPVVASDIPGYAAVIPTAAYGLLTPPRDAERLAWAICHLLRDDQLRASIGLHARQRAEQYSWTRTTAEIEAVYAASRLRSEERHAHRPQRRLSPVRMFRRQEQTIGPSGPSGWHISFPARNVVE